MPWIHLTSREARRMPWKNGGGTTLELAVEPPGATPDTGFAWRLSSAEVAMSGPFSAFPGIERTLLLLAGDGFRLDFGGHGSVILDRPLEVVRFSGDWPARADLLGGPCVDFNLMADPARCRARLKVLRLDGARRLVLDAATILVFVARGVVSVPTLDLHLGQGHLLRIEGGTGDLALVPGYGGGTAVIVVRID
jgi:environmental stress-induced protein Ves